MGRLFRRQPPPPPPQPGRGPNPGELPPPGRRRRERRGRLRPATRILALIGALALLFVLVRFVVVPVLVWLNGMG